MTRELGSSPPHHARMTMGGEGERRNGSEVELDLELPVAFLFVRAGNILLGGRPEGFATTLVTYNLRILW
jgi:hypothetical protein